MGLPNKPDAIPVDWHAYIKAALIFAVLLVCLELGLNAASFLPFIILLLGALWLGWGFWIIYVSQTSKRWPVTQGAIVENMTGSVEAPLERHIIYYFPIISYRYTVGGIEYVSSRIVLFPSDLRIAGGGVESFADVSKMHHKDHLIARKLTEDFRAKFPLNSIVTIRFSPRSPKVGVLIVGTLSRSRQHSIVFLVLGSFLLLVGIFLFYVEFWIR